MRVRFDEGRQQVAMHKRASIETVPEYAVQTPLQRVVQILKRQRDVMFGDDPNRPISVIITTLAAHAYGNEADLATAYVNIVRGMRAHLDKRGEEYVILNPVNPQENFADRWLTEPVKRERFFEWLTQVEETERELSGSSTMEKRASILNETFGVSGALAADTAAKAFGIPKLAATEDALARQTDHRAVLDSLHRKPVPWQKTKAFRASVSAVATGEQQRPVRFSDRSPSPPLAKGMSLEFRLTTSAPPPYEVFWQVTNTGGEAAINGNLRGDFTHGKGKHAESTKFRGRHAIQAFVVKGGTCVAYSRPVYVVIR